MDCGERHRLNVLGTGLIETLAMAMLITALVGCAGYVPGRQAYWDEKVKEMCEKDGGAKIFETVELPRQEYNLLLNKFGTLEIPLDGPNARDTPLIRKEEKTSIRDGNPYVWRYEMVIIRRSDQKVLGRQVTYARVGGDFPSPAHQSSYSCPDKRINLFSAVVKQRGDEK